MTKTVLAVPSARSQSSKLLDSPESKQWITNYVEKYFQACTSVCVVSVAPLRVPVLIIAFSGLIGNFINYISGFLWNVNRSSSEMYERREANKPVQTLLSNWLHSLGL